MALRLRPRLQQSQTNLPPQQDSSQESFVLTPPTPLEHHSSVTNLPAIGIYFGVTTFPRSFECHSIVMCGRGYYPTPEFNLHDVYEKICTDFQVAQLPCSSDFEVMNAIISIPFEMGNSTPTDLCIMIETHVGGMFKLSI